MVPAPARVLRILGVGVVLVAGVTAVVVRHAAGQPHDTVTPMLWHEQQVGVVAFSPDGTVLAVAERYGERPVVRLWNVATRQRTGLLDTGGGVRTLAFSHDGRTVATAGWDTGIRLWDVASGRAVGALGRPDRIRDVAFGPDGKTLAAVGDDGTVRLWDVADGLAFATRTGRPAGAAAFSPDGRTLATAGHDDTVRVWDVTGGANTATLAGGAHTQQVSALAFSPDGRTLATSGRDHAVRLWDLPGGRNTATLTGHPKLVGSLAFSPDGRTLASAEVSSGDPKEHNAPAVRLWDVATGRATAVLAVGGTDPAGAKCWADVMIDTEVAFSSDGGTLAGNCGRAVRLWNPPAGR